MKNELLKIKKYYGEEMMHLCAKLYPTILEEEGRLFELLRNNFAYSKFLYEDIVKNRKVDNFKNFLLSFIEKDKALAISDKDPFTLMGEAGYNLYFCKNEKEVAKFNKYYQPIERICTFYSHRTYDHYVFFAVKKDVDNIKRIDFTDPRREDEYGTSVISIQFTKGNINSLSIKNRYNHAVDNPDATFSNNLDNIIPGLTDSFQKYFNLNIYPEDNSFDLDGYCRGKDGKLYKYNYEIDDIYYCVNNTIIDNGEVIEFAKEKYLIVDYFIIDLVHKAIRVYDKSKLTYNDGFIINKTIEKIEILNNFNGKEVKIIGCNFFVNLKLNKFNQIIGYESNLKRIGDEFLYYNKTLKSFVNYELMEIGNEFLTCNDTLVNLVAPKVTHVENYFLEENTTIEYILLSSLKEVGNNFLKNSTMHYLTLPNLEIVGSGFLAYNKFLQEVSLPNLKIVGNFFLHCNTFLTEIDFPKLEIVGSVFLGRNYRLKNVSLPKLEFIGGDFLANNEELLMLNLPNARDIGKNFLTNNRCLRHLLIPNVRLIGDNFLKYNVDLEELIAPNLLRVDNNFLEHNYSLKSVTLENIEMVGDNFLYNNNLITEINLPNLKVCGNNFLYMSNFKKKENRLVKK